MTKCPSPCNRRANSRLDDEEFKALIEFLREHYEPFRQGVKAIYPARQAV